jgi:peptidoglycan/xylan/chitin deacetylase (PgdA/CDA1 family)
VTATETTLDRGVFTLSLDFELIWGTLDRGPDAFREACERERSVVVDRLLALLAEFEISATWCTLGHLFLEGCAPRDGRKHPEIVPPRPGGIDDWFEHDPCGTEESDPIFYGKSLVDRILACAMSQEIGCHSFSHPMFGDPGCSRETAITELAECVRLAGERGLTLRSFAFPRNRVGHLDVLRDHGFTAYRGPDPTWYEGDRWPRTIKRLGHLVDVVLARRPPVVLPEETLPGLWNLPGSMIYFPMHGRRRHIPLSLRVSRALKGLDAAANERRVFHLWFHPTNLAFETESMLGGLRQIFERASALRRNGALSIRSMGDVVAEQAGARRRLAQQESSLSSP